MKAEFKLLDVVALVEDQQDDSLFKGQVGTIVEVLQPGIFEVEFSDTLGRAYAMQALPAEKLMRLYHEPVIDLFSG